MNVLWLNVTEPVEYNQENGFVGGWQDSLESIVAHCDEINLSIAFTTQSFKLPKKINRVQYIPIFTHYTIIDRLKKLVSWKTVAKKIISALKQIIETTRPDIIHVFGTEWPFGLISKFTDIPVVIHIQGSIVEYNKFIYPKNYNFIDSLYEKRYNLRHFVETLCQPFSSHSRYLMEKEIWNSNKFFMGRTNWDFLLSEKMHPHRIYFHVNEALRKPFTQSTNHWQYKTSNKIILFSTGCSTFWKAPNLLLQTAKILRDYEFSFEWFIAGLMPDHLKNIVERKEHSSFEKNNVFFLGWQTAEQIRQRLLDSSLYIHNAYIENSPNSICEAQIIGTPIISTNVGGIPSLIEDGKNGFLVPIDSPELMAKKIISLAHNKELLCEVSQNAQNTAIQRHNEKTILNQLLNCYKTILNGRTK